MKNSNKILHQIVTRNVATGTLLPISKRGITLLELLFAMAIFAIIAGIAIPAFSQYKEKAKISTAISDIKTLEASILAFYMGQGQYPNSLNDLPQNQILDPWGHPYQYLRIDGGDIRGRGHLRKDRNLVPINSDYDLYSMGKDGQSTSPLTARASQDDIIRANNGRYVGLAKDY